MMNWKDIPIPQKMQHLPKDRRGYPAPVILARDANDEPVFSVNDETARQLVIHFGDCAICGQRLNKDKWLVGGPLSALHPDGYYNDSEVHFECMEYALKVCPYLAAPSYGKGLGIEYGKKRLPNAMLHDPTVIGKRPPLFVAIHVHGTMKTYRADGGYDKLKPIKPYIDVRFYKEGREIESESEVMMLMAREYGE